MINYSENQKMNNKDNDCRGVFQSIKVLKYKKFQSFKVSKFQSFKVSKFQSKKFQRFKVSKIQSFKVKKGKYQRRGTARRAPTNPEFQRIAVPLQNYHLSLLRKKFQAKTMDCRSRCLPDHCASC